MFYYVKCDSKIKRLATIKYLMELGYPLVDANVSSGFSDVLSSRDARVDFERWPHVGIYGVDLNLKGSKSTYVDFCTSVYGHHGIKLEEVPPFNRNKLIFGTKKVEIIDDKILINNFETPKELFKNLQEYDFTWPMIIRGQTVAIGAYLNALGYNFIYKDSHTFVKRCTNYPNHKNVVIYGNGEFDLCNETATVALENVPIATQLKDRLIILSKNYLYHGTEILLTSKEYKEVLAAL